RSFANDFSAAAFDKELRIFGFSVNEAKFRQVQSEKAVLFGVRKVDVRVRAQIFDPGRGPALGCSHDEQVRLARRCLSYISRLKKTDARHRPVSLCYVGHKSSPQEPGVIRFGTAIRIRVPCTKQSGPTPKSTVPSSRHRAQRRLTSAFHPLRSLGSPFAVPAFSLASAGGQIAVEDVGGGFPFAADLPPHDHIFAG